MREKDKTRPKTKRSKFESHLKKKKEKGKNDLR